MKKLAGLFLCLILMFIAAGCGSSGSSARSGNQPAGVNDVLEAGMAKEDNRNETDSPDAVRETEETGSGRQTGVNEDAPEPESVRDAAAASVSTEGIDVDLTALSSTMVYSEVYNMMVSPEQYIGKTVKMNGAYAIYHDEAADINYYACIIADATACCSQGIEFVLTDDYSYPEDYPEKGSTITVTGVFDTYTEGEYQYCTLRNASLKR